MLFWTRISLHCWPGRVTWKGKDIGIICLRLIMSSNDFTLETIALSLPRGSSSSPFVIGRIWEIIQGYVFNKTWKAVEEHAGLFCVSFLDYFLSTIAACCNTWDELYFLRFTYAFVGQKKKTHCLPKNTILDYFIAWIGKIRDDWLPKTTLLIFQRHG